MNDTEPGAEQSRGTERLTGAEWRAAARAFLQRCEVRISSLHRASGFFVGGSGLLFIAPSFLTTVMAKLLALLMPYLPPDLTHPYPLMVLVLLIIIALSPFYLLVSVLKGLSRFYYMVSVPWLKESPDGHGEKRTRNFFFTLFPLSFPEKIQPGETEIEGRYDGQYLRYDAAYKSSLRRNQTLLPTSRRRLAFLNRKLDLFENPLPDEADSKELTDFVWDEYVSKVRSEYGIPEDMTLAEEVGRTENMMLRLQVQMSNVVIRYFKTLSLMFVMFVSIWLCSIVIDTKQPPGTGVAIEQLPDLVDPQIRADHAAEWLAPLLMLTFATMGYAFRLPLRWFGYREGKTSRFERRTLQKILWLIAASGVLTLLTTIRQARMQYTAYAAVVGIISIFLWYRQKKVVVEQ